MQSLTINEPFKLECGAVLPSITIGYHTYGRLNADHSNAIWVCHALTASSEVAEWWPNTISEGRFLDPEKYFVVCANMLGSCYGSTGPLSLNPQTNKPWYDEFPQVTVRDMVRAHQLLAQHLGIKQLHLLVGSSIGGFQAMEWLIMEPQITKKAVLIATTAKISAWASALNESQRMAIETDPSFGEHREDAGLEGMKAARSIALLSYRGPAAYNQTQTDDGEEPFRRRVHSYQRHQGEKLAARFNAYSYYRLSQSVDSQNVGRQRGGVEQALAQISANTLVVAINTDVLFPPDEVKRLADGIRQSRFLVINSHFGHDGFLVEANQLNELILNFMNSEQ